MLFLKVTRSAKKFGTRFGWLIAELLFVFLGMYGAFLLERMHDDDMDLLRKRQILQALVDEFADYDQELGTASSSLDEAYGVPFFTAYAAGERPFPTPIPFGGMGSVNTGIWEAMLQGGGLELLEVEIIQEVQNFFKKLQDLLDLYSRFERLTEKMILPEMDQDVTFFYQAEGPELRDKYKWYVNSLFTIGMSLRTLSEQAATTKKVLLVEYEKIRQKEEKEKDIKQHTAPRRKQSHEPKLEPLQEEPSIEEEIVEDTEVSEELENARSEAIEYLFYQCKALAEFFETTKEGYDEAHAIPFFTSYSEGEQPLPFSVSPDLLVGVNTEPLAGLLTAEGVDDVLPADLLNSLRQLLGKVSETESLHQDFAKRCEVELSTDHDLSVYYDMNNSELKEDYQWFPNTLYTLGLALDDCYAETQSVITAIGKNVEKSKDPLKSEPQRQAENKSNFTESNESNHILGE